MSVRTLIEVVKLSSDYLDTHGSESPRLDAELLAAHALKLRRLDLYLQFDRPLEDDELTAIRDLVRRRSGGEPVGYIVGRREFWGRDFAVSPDVLIPRSDTETLIETVVTWAAQHGADKRPLRLLDVGTGSGCIAVTLTAELDNVTSVATDISAAALEIARSNAGSVGVDERMEFRVGEWGTPLRSDEVFDIIVSNPPYILAAEMAGLERDVREFEPHVALADSGDGLESYRRVAAIAAAHLAPGGVLAVEVDARRAQPSSDVMTQALAGMKARTVCDLAGRERVVVLERG